MINSVFAVSGQKIASCLVDDESIKFSGKSFDSVLAFQEAWNKTISFNSRTEIRYESIRAIRKEVNDADVKISYKTGLGILATVEFSFDSDSDFELFASYLTEELGYQRDDSTLRPIKSLGGSVTRLLITLAITALGYYEALRIADGEHIEVRRVKLKLFVALVEFLGTKGVLAVGGLIAAYFAYLIYTRYKTPPAQIQLLPPGVN